MGHPALVRIFTGSPGDGKDPFVQFETHHPPTSTVGTYISTIHKGVRPITAIVHIYTKSLTERHIGNTERGQEIVCVYVR